LWVRASASLVCQSGLTKACRSRGKGTARMLWVGCWRVALRSSLSLSLESLRNPLVQARYCIVVGIAQFLPPVVGGLPASWLGEYLAADLSEPPPGYRVCAREGQPVPFPPKLSENRLTRPLTAPFPPRKLT
jgi:hypothetical protein